MKPVHLLSDEELAQMVRRAAALPDAPPALLRAAVDQWKAGQPSPLQAAARAVVSRVAAILTFDSWAPGSPALGVRAVPSDTRHLLFSALGRDIDVRITPSASQFALTGQVLGPDESGAIELASTSGAGGAPPSTLLASLDALGEFRFEGVPRGAYVLTLRVGEDEVVLPPIDVGELRR